MVDITMETLVELTTKIETQAAQIKELEGDVKRENTSHNYHCKESQRKNGVIETLEKKNAILMEAVEGISGNMDAFNGFELRRIAGESLEKIKALDKGGR